MAITSEEFVRYKACVYILASLLDSCYFHSLVTVVQHFPSLGSSAACFNLPAALTCQLIIFPESVFNSGGTNWSPSQVFVDDYHRTLLSMDMAYNPLRNQKMQKTATTVKRVRWTRTLYTPSEPLTPLDYRPKI